MAHNLCPKLVPFDIAQTERTVADLEVAEPGNSAEARQASGEFRFIDFEFSGKVAENVDRIKRNFDAFALVITGDCFQIVLG